MKTYHEVLQYLGSFIDYERKAFFPYRKSLKLERVKNFLEYAKIPYERLQAIHIAGTKGKGSTATFCAHMLAASGFKVGLYTSPHFFDFRERIQIIEKQTTPACRMGRDDRRHPPAGRAGTTDNIEQKTAIRSRLIGRGEVVRIVEQMQPHLEKLRFSKKLGTLTFFEVYTAVAFRYFLDEKVDFAVLETGLGGRLDATNVVMPLVSIITHIGYDHTDKLGNKLSQIAAEKAGIIKKGIPLVSSAQRKSVLEVFRKKCKLQKSPFFLSGRDFSVRNITYSDQRTLFDFAFNDLSARQLEIGLLGKYQVENASLALTALELLKQKGILKNLIPYNEGLASARIEGRFEVLNLRPLVVVDIAHNPSAFTVLAQNLKLYFPGKKVILIFAASRDKDVRNMLNKLKPKRIILTSFKNPRAYVPLEIQKHCNVRNALIAQDIAQAFKVARGLYANDSLIVISGSLFLASEAKALLSRAASRKQSA